MSILSTTTTSFFTETVEMRRYAFIIENTNKDQNAFTYKGMGTLVTILLA